MVPDFTACAKFTTQVFESVLNWFWLFKWKVQVIKNFQRLPCCSSTVFSCLSSTCLWGDIQNVSVLMYPQSLGWQYFLLVGSSYLSVFPELVLVILVLLFQDHIILFIYLFIYFVSTFIKSYYSTLSCHYLQIVRILWLLNTWFLRGTFLNLNNFFRIWYFQQWLYGFC